MFRNINKWPLTHWHIEISSKCSLRCPRCTRQEVPDNLINTDLNLSWFQHNFSNVIKEAKKITFCGDDGDPIYARELIEIIAWMKQQNKNIQIVIVTNGSYKTEQWWQQLNDVLDSTDHIHFSIDGWDQHSNNIYRVNCNWNSIEKGIAQIHTPIKTWAAIAFKFNENKIDHMRQMARDFNFDYFQLTLSTKFGSNYDAYPKDDPLQPSEQYVARGRFTRSTDHLSNRVWIDHSVADFKIRYDAMPEHASVKALCAVGNKGLYINSLGQFYPCCWTGLRYEHNKNLFEYIDRTQSFERVLDDPNWRLLFDSFATEKCPAECSEKCSANKWSLEHATSW
jgi:MoaA/NifB/PqqE/SkfB family radical SAM enzyme